MPELPEAETIARGLHRCLKGIQITGVKLRTRSLRQPVDARKLRRETVGRKIISARRRGKAILVDLEENRSVMIQLGMTGACRVCPQQEPLTKHEHVIFSLSNNKSWRFEDPRRFGMVEIFRTDQPEKFPDFLKRLGPEPMQPGFTEEYLYTRTRNRTRAIKDFLMDQAIVAGIGNIYACEILFRAEINPGRECGSLTGNACKAIVKSTKKVLGAAIRAGGTTISDYRDVDGTAGRFARKLLVYGRDKAPCSKCRTPIERIIQGGRSTFFCPQCQR